MAYYDKYGVEFSDDGRTLLKFDPKEECPLEYVIPEGVTNIAPYAFDSDARDWLFSVIIPSTVTTIGKRAFHGWNRIWRLSVPDSVIHIGEDAFKGILNVDYSGSALGAPWGAKCINGHLEHDLLYSDIEKTNLKLCMLNAVDMMPNICPIYIPSSVAKIDYNAFSECYGISSIHVHSMNMNYCSIDGVLYSKDMTSIICYPDFQDKAEFIIPDTIQNIAPFAFSAYTKEISSSYFDDPPLLRIHFPASVANIDSTSFHGGRRIYMFDVNHKNLYFCDIEGVLYSKDKRTLVRYPDEKENTSYAIPDATQTINDYAFEECSNLELITIPNSVISIGKNGFASCRELKKIIVPDSVVHVQERAFCNCHNIQEVILSNSMKSIEPYTFAGCRELKKIIIPDSVVHIQENAFCNCHNLQEVILSNSIKLIEYNAFYQCDLQQITLPDSIMHIEECAFEKCDNLSSIIVPFGQKERFSKMEGLKKLVDKIVEAEPQMVTSASDSLSFQSHRKKRPIIPENPLKNVTSLRAREIAEIRDTLEANDIHYFYHFTSLKNIASIKELGGLYSWYYLNQHHINIPLQGGGDLSKQLDMRSEIANYVHLSFCKNHPMSYRLIQDGEDMVVLKISTEVALLDGTMFSDMNAVDKNATRALGMVGLQNINFEATKEEYLTSDNPLFKYKQAEVMVKTCVPSRYILNLDDF